MSWRNWNNLSIVPRIATGWWTIGRSGKTVIQCWCGVRTVVGSSPMMTGWRVAGGLVWFPVVVDDLVHDVVLLGVVEMLSVG